MCIRDSKITNHNGELLKVWSDKLEPNLNMQNKINFYKNKVDPYIGEVVGKSSVRLVRDYVAESSLGNFSTDVMRAMTGSEIAFQNAGGLRADLPEGPITKGNVLDAFPFHNTLVSGYMTGKQIKKILEQGLSLERGMIQVSGIKAFYDLEKSIGKRLISAEVNGEPLKENKEYLISTQSFLGEGGDLYDTFLEVKYKDTEKYLSDVVIAHLKDK